MRPDPGPLAGDARGCATCPRSGFGMARPRPGSPSYPVGVVHRVAAVGPPIRQDDDREAVDETKRSILKLAVVAGAVAAAAGGGAALVRYLVPPPRGLGAYPRVQLLYDDGSPVLASSYPYGPSNTDLILFDYPLTNEPNMLLNLAAAAPNGVGPNSTLVAYSAICQHEGSEAPYISYYPPGSCSGFNNGNAFIHCIVHGSTYDPGVAASYGGAPLITGPASNALPQILLDWDPTTDFVYAVGAAGVPVYGHVSTLSGGSEVPAQVQLQSPMTPDQECP